MTDRDTVVDRMGSEMLGPLRVLPPRAGELSFFGVFATFDTPFEVTTSELAIELLFPADLATAEALRAFARNRPLPLNARTRERRGAR